MAFQLDRKWLIAGAAAVVILIVIVKARSSSSSGGTTVVPQNITGATTGAAAISTGQLASFETQLTISLDKAISQLQAGGSGSSSSGSSGAATGTTTTTNPAPPVTTGSGNPAPTTTTGSPAPTTPANPVTPVAPPAGSVSVNGQVLDYISTPAEGSALAAAGQTIDAVIAGSVVPVVVNGQRTAAWSNLPAGTRLYDQPKA